MFQFYCVWLLVELIVVYFLWVETKVSYLTEYHETISETNNIILKNTPLEEIAKIFDGEDAHVGGPAATKSGQVVLEQIEERDKTEAKDL